MDRSNLRGYTRREAPSRESAHAPAQAPVVATAEPPKVKKTRRQPSIPANKPWKPVLIALVAILFVWLGYGYIHTKNQLTKLSNPQVANESATQQTIDKVSKLVQLPTGETPDLYTVNNASSLKNEVFFANAQNGDLVLNFPKANKAVLYRPSTNKVIEFSSPNLGSGTSSSSQ